MNTIDAEMLKKMFLSGAALLESKKEYINELNVFPVPDGDTGTNMTMTIVSAKKEVEKLSQPTLESLCKAVSSGSLRGARGNSGVILSQIFRGFNKEISLLDEIGIMDLGNGVIHASDTAYKAVMKPKEGTILTVISDGAKKSRELMENEDIENIAEFLEAIAEEMEASLKRTPELLPVLKEAGVVDSGGEGLMTFVRGAISALNGKEIVYTGAEQTTGSTGAVKSENIETEDIKFGYCTEFIIMLDENKYTGEKSDLTAVEKELKKYLNNLGDCVVVVADDDIVKVHVHTNAPGLAIQKGLTFGALTSMKIDNMREEHNEKVIKEAAKESSKEAEDTTKEAVKATPTKENGFIAVSAGEGLSNIFRDLGVDIVVEGGQTMNPSTDDILEAIEKVPAKNVYIFPNNGNIILAANQAAELTEDRNVIVIPTVNIPQGINVMINYVADRTSEENKEKMMEDMEKVSCGQVTFAVRDTTMNGFDIKKDDFMGMTGKEIVAIGKTSNDAACELIKKMINDDSELVCIYYGADVSEEEANELADTIMDETEAEAEVQYGGQPVYSYIISVE